MRISPLSGLPAVVIACGSLVAAYCARVRFQFRSRDLLFIAGKQFGRTAFEPAVKVFQGIGDGQKL
jgi:hypothetical protein